VYNQDVSTNSAQIRQGGLNMTSGEKMRSLRGKKSKRKVSEELGISFSSYAKYERNERIPRDDVKIKIAKYFHSSVQDIFFEQAEHK
jgi:DNA-binding XRE family transcriptional regulator